MPMQVIKHGSGLPAGRHGAIVAVAAMAALLGACATPVRETPRQVAAVQSVHAVAESDDLPLKLIAAEYALQRGDLATAAKVMPRPRR
ncbi:MAG: hypothetical protein IPH43_11790 [Xanthomonadales bacterium]|nr:hypothetical protein [Xanthomonadales bacterium]